MQADGLKETQTHRRFVVEDLSIPQDEPATLPGFNLIAHLQQVPRLFQHLLQTQTWPSVLSVQLGPFQLEINCVSSHLNKIKQRAGLYSQAQCSHKSMRRFAELYVLAQSSHCPKSKHQEEWHNRSLSWWRTWKHLGKTEDAHIKPKKVSWSGELHMISTWCSWFPTVFWFFLPLV